MQINWFPGHMNKATRLIEQNLKLVDIVIYVLDSRAPNSCINPVFDKLFADKKKIYVLNKADLAPVSQVKAWVEHFTAPNSAALALDSTASKSASSIALLAKKMCSEKLEKFLSRGIRTSIRALVAGVPNCGKSTLINNLAGKSKTLTGNKPGVTKGLQWVRVTDYFEVLDSPGTLYPKLDDEVKARRLSFIGSIKDEVIDKTELSLMLIDELNALDPEILIKRFNLEGVASSHKMLESMALKRGYILKGSIADIDRMAVALIDDFKKGRLGRIILDKI